MNTVDKTSSTSSSLFVVQLELLVELRTTTSRVTNVLLLVTY